jgi:hypothetical protein
MALVAVVVRGRVWLVRVVVAVRRVMTVRRVIAVLRVIAVRMNQP